MIRAITVTSLVVLLMLVLYLPSAFTTERFVHQLAADHAAVTDFWGETEAARLLDSALSRQQDVQTVAPLPNAYDAPSTQRLEGAVAQEMTSVNDRLFNSPYFRSVDAMLMLATYRGSLALRWALWLIAFPVAMAADSLVSRHVKSLELGHHDPEVFALLACLAITTICAALLLLVLPVSLHPACLPTAPLLALTLLALAIASYHPGL